VLEINIILPRARAFKQQMATASLSVFASTRAGGRRHDVLCETMFSPRWPMAVDTCTYVRTYPPSAAECSLQPESIPQLRAAGHRSRQETSKTKHRAQTRPQLASPPLRRTHNRGQKHGRVHFADSGLARLKSWKLGTDPSLEPDGSSPTLAIRRKLLRSRPPPNGCSLPKTQ
jgi:hypothetical protein